jgi:hypothetical protein
MNFSRNNEGLLDFLRQYCFLRFFFSSPERQKPPPALFREVFVIPADFPRIFPERLSSFSPEQKSETTEKAVPSPSPESSLFTDGRRHA